MNLSNDLIKEFASLINNKNTKSESPKSTTAYGTTSVTDGKKFVQIDGSDYLTPISEATEAKDGDRVLVEIKEHKAVVIGNFTAPPSLQASKDANKKAENALDKADEALKDLEDAKDYAEDAKKDAEEASKKAQEAIDIANQSKDASAEAQRLIGVANTEIDKLRDEIKDVTVDTEAVRETVKEELPAILEETVSAEYAKKTDLVEVKGELEARIRMTAGDLRTEFSEHYVTQSKLVKIEETLNTKINQNSEEILLSASALTKLDTDDEEIKALINTATTKVNEAITKANQAKEVLLAAEQDLLNADSDLAIAREHYEEALEHYEKVTNRDDATEQEIYEATNALREAEQAVDDARSYVEAAYVAVDSAIENAEAAEEALIQARKDLAEIISSITDQITQLKVNAQGAVIENNLIKTFKDNYYDKEEINTKFELEAGNITLEVTKNVEENITVGGTNLCPGTSSDWTEFTLGSDYVVIKRFKMEDLCEKYCISDGEKLTYSIQLKTDTGKRLAASWQKYNNANDRVAEVSDDTIIASNGRSIVHPVIDLKYEYLDLMVSNLSENITEDTTEYYRCLQLEKGNVATDWGLTAEETNNDNIDVGGRNLILNSELYEHAREDVTYNFLMPAPSFYNSDYGVALISEGGEFTISFDYEITGITTECLFYISLQYKSGNNWRRVTEKYSLDVGDNFGHCEDTFTPDDDMKSFGQHWCVSGFGAGANAGAVIKIINIKLEKGLVATDWTPAPEDVDDSINSVQDNVNETNDKVSNIEKEVIQTVTRIQLLEDKILSLVTDENGNSLLTQTSTGWSFDLSGLESNLNKSADTLNQLKDLVGELSAQTGGLASIVDNLEETSEYVWVTTYGDQPCLALGESDTSYGLFITNKEIIFVDGTGNPTYIDNGGMFTNKLSIGSELRHKNYIWSVRQNGNYGLMWKQLKARKLLPVVYTGGTVPVGIDLDSLTGIVAKVEYNDGTTARITDYELSGTIAEGNNTITLTYEGLSITFIVPGGSSSSSGSGSGSGSGDVNIDQGEATSVTFGYMTIGTSQQAIIYYSDTVTMNNGKVELTNAKNFTFKSGVTEDTCKLPIGKYVHATANAATGGDVYYIDPSATYSIYTETSTGEYQFTSRRIKYTPAYLVTSV